VSALDGNEAVIDIAVQDPAHLHVVFVAHWIGGVAFVTLVALPLARSHGDVGKGWALFEAIETRFASQVRVSIPPAGVTGLWMAVPVYKASHQRAAGMASTTASPIVISPSLMTSA
jgi:uncharacterized membrane protein